MKKGILVMTAVVLNVLVFVSSCGKNSPASPGASVSTATLTASMTATQVDPLITSTFSPSVTLSPTVTITPTETRYLNEPDIYEDDSDDDPDYFRFVTPGVTENHTFSGDGMCDHDNMQLLVSPGQEVPVRFTNKGAALYFSCSVMFYNYNTGTYVAAGNFNNTDFDVTVPADCGYFCVSLQEGACSDAGDKSYSVTIGELIQTPTMTPTIFINGTADMYENDNGSYRYVVSGVAENHSFHNYCDADTMSLETTPGQVIPVRFTNKSAAFNNTCSVFFFNSSNETDTTPVPYPAGDFDVTVPADCVVMRLKVMDASCGTAMEKLYTISIGNPLPSATITRTSTATRTATPTATATSTVAVNQPDIYEQGAGDDTQATVNIVEDFVAPGDNVYFYQQHTFDGACDEDWIKIEVVLDYSSYINLSTTDSTSAVNPVLTLYNSSMAIIDAQTYLTISTDGTYYIKAAPPTCAPLENIGYRINFEYIYMP